MYCNKCGGDDHFASQCVAKVSKLKRPYKPSVVSSEGVNAETLRKRRWRENNRERYNAYQKELMRKRRDR